MIWDDAAPPPRPAPGPLGWLRVVLRGGTMAIVVFGGLAVLLLLRLIERPLHGVRRPWTPWITQGVCITALRILGLRRVVRGVVMKGTGAVVANHASWLDIFVLNASKRIYFVAKSEVAGWPGIGWLARATGTVFIRRDPREAKAQQLVFEERLGVGHRLLFFPEGTSTDGRRVIPFKTTLFAAFRSGGLPDDMQVQPVTVAYHAPEGERADFYGWWGDQSFAAHMLLMLSAPRHGRVDVIYHPPLAVSDYADRKALARAAEAAVRRGFEAVLPDCGGR
ncbi:lysophospholipid acyltransferase family protein [Jannaschia marina]|uniref:lysophospholipid acyltransferase family protein n=1 Tax=Jannaschia marina TaxID=2741674 RepID=UPI0015C9E10A|nr:lysophospholipid acyltransferase family protein [Jannaschia marina]